MQSAAFSLTTYTFNKVLIDLSKQSGNELSIDFQPSGKFYQETSDFELEFMFRAFTQDKISEPFIQITCTAKFHFESSTSFENIPSYFYKNSIAILFPYVRAFVSTVTLQANIPPVILPTMNLSALENPLKEKTIIIPNKHQ